MIDRLRAAIEERLKLAKAATTGPWVVRANYPQGIVSPAFLDGPDSVSDAETWLISTTLTDRPEADAAHIAANDPAFVILACERDLRALERHAPQPGDWAAVQGCEHEVACWGCRQIDHGVSQPWPCDEINDLAAVYGIEVTE